ncbi:PC4/YdbC family ssDNA-binding protein [uncultured Litoreibacter sp.]|uniref:PC4/YdbC family ssDNA-binding protein n=1 Tax=uncultured Litoreibacter sp. TaxID=1392394 RepID=UPI00260DB921|nr:PC4/YdbC family ssDNA-binding protein [uncultured Litoreibacter sp.]
MPVTGTITKNVKDEIRVSRDECNGLNMINLRVSYAAVPGEKRPSKQGVAFRASILPEMMEALDCAGQSGGAE